MTQPTLIAWLWRQFARDRYKSEPCIAGWRTTRDVAEAFGWSMRAARARLDALYETDDIECVDMGNHFCWYVRPRAGNDDDGEEAPVLARVA